MGSPLQSGRAVVKVWAELKQAPPLAPGLNHDAPPYARAGLAAFLYLSVLPENSNFVLRRKRAAWEGLVLMTPSAVWVPNPSS